jgi:5-methylcytosine-specific restriction enzyme subunit McrC
LRSLRLDAWSQLSCELSHAEAAEIGASGLVDVVAEPAPGRWRLIGKSRVGVVAGSGWEVRVRPRLDVPQLLFLLAYAEDPSGWRDQTASFAAEPDLLDAVANGFSLQALRSVEQGLLRGYVQVQAREQAIRGRVRFAEQISRSADLPLPIEVSYDDYTADVIENQILKTATLHLLRLGRVPVLARRRLQALRTLLDQVTLLDRPGEVAMPILTRLNDRYRIPLRLAELILRAASIGEAQGSFSSSSFVFDMNRVFEDFLTTALREALALRGGDVRPQASIHLDWGGQLSLRPDVTWFLGGEPRAVLDAKHKDPGKAPPPGDIYQMLAYCTALGLSRGYLVYARDGPGVRVDHAVRNSSCEIRIRALDIELPPDLLLAQVDQLAAELAADPVPLCGSS